MSGTIQEQGRSGTATPGARPLSAAQRLLGVTSPKNAVEQMAAILRANTRWLTCMSLVVLIWTLELYCVQAYTLLDPNGTGPRFEFWAPKVRLLMDLLFVSTLTFWLPR